MKAHHLVSSLENSVAARAAFGGDVASQRGARGEGVSAAHEACACEMPSCCSNAWHVIAPPGFYGGACMLARVRGVVISRAPETTMAGIS